MTPQLFWFAVTAALCIWLGYQLRSLRADRQIDHAYERGRIAGLIESADGVVRRLGAEYAQGFQAGLTEARRLKVRSGLVVVGNN